MALISAVTRSGLAEAIAIGFVNDVLNAPIVMLSLATQTAASCRAYRRTRGCMDVSFCSIRGNRCKVDS